MALSGPIDLDGTVGSTVILPGWDGLNAAEELSSRLDLHVAVDNDANLGALAEVSFGAGRGLSDVIYVMVSSGIGAGLVIGGRLHRGATGFAGELGHVRVRAEGAVCRCGNRGCLETVASTDALLELLRPAHGSDLGVRGLRRAGRSRRPRVRSGSSTTRAARSGACSPVSATSSSPAAVIVGGDLSWRGRSAAHRDRRGARPLRPAERRGRRSRSRQACWAIAPRCSARSRS